MAQARLTANNTAITIKVKWDKNVAHHTAILPLGFPQLCPVHQLGPNLLNGLPVTIQAL